MKTTPLFYVCTATVDTDDGDVNVDEDDNVAGD